MTLETSTEPQLPADDRSRGGAVVRPQLHFARETIALDELERRGARAAQALVSRGTAPGGVVALLLRNEPAFIEALSCIRCLGATRVLIPTHLAPAEIHRILDAVEPSVLIGHRDLLRPLARQLADYPRVQVAVVDPHRTPNTECARSDSPVAACTWQDLAQSGNEAAPMPRAAPRAISLSSGSTGAPKVIGWDGVQSWDRWYANRTTDRPLIKTSIITAPLYYGAQYGVFSQSWRMRANHVLMPRFDAEAFLAAVERHHVTHAYLVPTMFVRLLRLPDVVRQRYDVSSLTYILHSGAHLSAHIKRQMIDWLGPIYWDAYGCSELSTIAVSSSTEWADRPGTVGKPVRPVAILDDTGRPCPTLSHGHIHVSVNGMPSVTCNGKPVPLTMVDGVPMLPTGDFGWMDPDGYLFISGRCDELINTGRVKVYPAEIEAAILQHPAVLECCVFGIPDEEFGRRIGAVLQVEQGASNVDEEIRALLERQLSPHKIPTHWWIQHSRIHEETGKINRVALAARLLSPSNA